MSQITRDDQGKILLLVLANLEMVLNKIKPNHVHRLDIIAVTTLIVQNLFSDARSRTEIPLLSQLCNFFRRVVKERLERHTGCPFSKYPGTELVSFSMICIDLL